MATIPGYPPLETRLPFPANPAPTYDYDSDRPLEADRGGAARVARRDYSIKHMVTR